MDKKYLIIANWKMNLTLSESEALAKKYKKLGRQKNIELAVAPTYPALIAAAKIFKRSPIKLVGQNAAAERVGAYTGEVSAAVLKEIGCSYVILGHSERKRYFGENLILIKQKVKTALAEDLIPVICVGENWEERVAGSAEAIIDRRVKEVLSEIGDLADKKIVISYEPFWSISSSHGRIATRLEVENACLVIKQSLIDLYGPEKTSEHFRIIYGGTVGPETVSSFLDLAIIEGFLVGAVSLDINKFQQLLESF